ncbi:signal peptidase II [candidate division KSB1 bacterium]|nr:signal peptidase II [candidate division KSB1 bacterium]
MKRDLSKRLYLVSGLVLVIDQISKWTVKLSMDLYESRPVIGDFFKLTYIENPGMAFGIRFGDNIFFTVFAIIASIAILVYMLRMRGEHPVTRLALALIFGGAIGNLVDRVIRGRVIDFFDVEFFNIDIPPFRLLFFDFPGYHMDRWPVFNVADMGVTIGMLLLLVVVLFESRFEPSKEEESESESEFIH